MIADFGSWFARQGKEEIEESEEEMHFECIACGKWEYVKRAAYENGDTGWYSDDPESERGLCGGSQFCIP